MSEDRMCSAAAHTGPDGEYAFVRTLVVEASESDPSRLGVPAPMDQQTNVPDYAHLIGIRSLVQPFRPERHVIHR